MGKKLFDRGLPSSLLSVLESDGAALTGIQVADTAIAVHHTDALREHRRALGQLDPPRRWAGSERAVDFVRSLGFSPEWAGERRKSRDPLAASELHVIVTTIQTLNARLSAKGGEYDFLSDFELVVVDEAHRSIAPTFTSVMQEIGLTRFR